MHSAVWMCMFPFFPFTVRIARGRCCAISACQRKAHPSVILLTDTSSLQLSRRACKCTHVCAGADKLFAEAVMFDCMIRPVIWSPLIFSRLSGRLPAGETEWICRGDLGSEMRLAGCVLAPPVPHLLLKMLRGKCYIYCQNYLFIYFSSK